MAMTMTLTTRIRALLALSILTMSTLTSIRSTVWTSDTTLWSAELHAYPSPSLAPPRTLFNAGSALRDPDLLLLSRSVALHRVNPSGQLQSQSRYVWAMASHELAIIAAVHHDTATAIRYFNEEYDVPAPAPIH